jgi:hypothetical protein
VTVAHVPATEVEPLGGGLAPEELRVMVQGMHPEFDDEWETLGCVWITVDRRGNQFPFVSMIRVDSLPCGQSTTGEEIREPEYYYSERSEYCQFQM